MDNCNVWVFFFNEDTPFLIKEGTEHEGTKKQEPRPGK